MILVNYLTIQRRACSEQDARNYTPRIDNRNKYIRDKCLLEFVTTNRLKLTEEYPHRDTFYYHNGLYSSQIDYIMHKCNGEVLNYRVTAMDMDMDPINVSDHTLVYATIQTTFKQSQRETLKSI